jgi:hypothetical protein
LTSGSPGTFVSVISQKTEVAALASSESIKLRRGNRR